VYEYGGRNRAGAPPRRSFSRIDSGLHERCSLRVMFPAVKTSLADGDPLSRAPVVIDYSLPRNWNTASLCPGRPSWPKSG
jgi:hypothetical protein